MSRPAAGLGEQGRARLWAAAVLLAVLGAGACDAGATGPGTREVVGIVTAVEGSSPTQVSRFSLRTGDGQAFTFDVGLLQVGGDAFPAGHLREHQATAQAVRVTYREEGGRLVAVRLRDAP